LSVKSRLLQVGIEYSIREVIRDHINYCAKNFAIGKICAYDQIVIKNLKRKRYGYQINFYMNFHLKDDLRMKFIV